MTRVDVIKAMAKANYEFENGFGSWDLVSENSQVKLCRFMSSALSALESLGIALVPVEATFEMVQAGQDATIKNGWRATFAGFLSASPLRKTEGGEE